MAHKQAHEARQRESHKKPRRPQPSLLERIQPDAAGVDCGERSHFVAVPLERDPEPVREFRTFTAELIRLADWLAQCRVRTLAMESTGVYWIPLYEILEERGFEVVLVNARDVHNVPGRKSDVQDCEWLRELHSVGLLRSSFRPAAEIVPLRSYMRQRETLVEEASTRIMRMQKALTQMNLILHLVVTDITGATGLAIISAILVGQRDPHCWPRIATTAATPHRPRLPPPSPATIAPSTCLRLGKTLKPINSCSSRALNAKPPSKRCWRPLPKSRRSLKPHPPLRAVYASPTTMPPALRSALRCIGSPAAPTSARSIQSVRTPRSN
jgi:Transposase